MNFQKSLSLKKYSVSDRNFLDKKQPPPSIRYASVRSKTNAGFNTSKRHQIEKEILKYYNVRSDEVFKRISLGDLIHLMVAYAEERNLIGLPPECVPSTELECAENRQDLENDKTNDLQDSLDEQNLLKVHHSVRENSTPLSYPFLLIDVRAESDFKEFHLATAIWHPHSRLSRSVGWECSEMRESKNHPEKLIVIYDENESLSADVAAMLIHRGYSNIFVLSGGIKLARDKIGYPFVTKDCSKVLSSVIANFLSERLAFTAIPSHQMQDTVNWLETKVTKPQSQNSRTERESVVSKGKPHMKKSPWR